MLERASAFQQILHQSKLSKNNFVQHMTSTDHHNIHPQIKSLTIPIQISFSSSPMTAKTANARTSILSNKLQAS